MSQPTFPTPILPFTAILYRSDLISLETCLKEHVKDLFSGTVFDFSQEKFSLVNYYEKEMGPKEKLKRAFIFSKETGNREDLSSLKIQSNQLEERLKVAFTNEGRVVNFDPGFLGLEQVVLATCKPYSHRIYLNQGIYAELTFQFQQGHWHELPWTYPDYREKCVKNLFDVQRNLLKRPLK
ncbi:MAG: DUF4416 family protein [Halobacteriovoraceae bacterium]|nr:DUF4416 family protein [Halobacteriovoraceae bacterium]